MAPVPPYRAKWPPDEAQIPIIGPKWPRKPPYGAKMDPQTGLRPPRIGPKRPPDGNWIPKKAQYGPKARK